MKVKAGWGDKTLDTVNVTLLTLIGAAMLFPFYYVFVVSFTDPTEYLRKGMVMLPENWSLASYRYMFSSDAFMRSIGVSGILATGGTLCSLLVSSSLAYAVSQKRLVGRRVILLFILFTILFSAGMIPNYLLIRELGLINSLWALIIPALSNGWTVLLMKGFFETIPESLQESARIDGANDAGVWLRIILPLSLPAMAAFGLFFAVGYWNTFFSAVLYINDHEKWPLQVFLQNILIDSVTGVSGDAAREMLAEKVVPPDTLKMASVVIATVPIILVYPFLQKHFTKGAMLGSVKE